MAGKAGKNKVKTKTGKAGKNKVKTKTSHNSLELTYECKHCKLQLEMRYAEYYTHQNACEKKLKAKSAAEMAKAEAAEMAKAEAAAANPKNNRSKKNR